VRDRSGKLRGFYESPGGRILRWKKRRMDALSDEALRAFASSFERTFMAGLCAAAEVECPSWVTQQASR
jgi:hypothetical protein